MVSRGPLLNPSKTLQRPFRDPCEILAGSGGPVAGNESLDSSPLATPNAQGSFPNLSLSRSLSLFYTWPKET